MSDKLSNEALPVLLPGDKLDRYQIIEQIACGGSSIVYLAHDVLLGDEVAIKQFILDAQSDASALAEAVDREVDLLRRLSDDQAHIARVIRAIHDARGHFVVTEFVRGENLQQAIARAGQPAKITSALKIIAMTAKALAVMHDRGILHRDIKPSNILLPKAGGLKICDVGLAALADQQQPVTMGSVQYMAPELLRGETVDGRADIYSLGMIAYKLLAGSDAFSQAFNAVARAKNPSLRWMKWHTNPRLVAPAIDQLNPAVPAWLAELISRMLAKAPAERIASAAQIEQVIRRHLSPAQDASVPLGSPAAAPADAQSSSAAASFSDQTASLPSPRGRRWLVVSAIASVVAVAASLGVYAVVAADARDAARHQVALRLLDQARAAARSGDFKSAVTLYTRLVTEDSGDAVLGAQAMRGKWLAEAREEMAHQQYDLARHSLEQLDQMRGSPRQTVRDLLDEVRRHEAFARGVKQIQSAIDQHNFASATRLINGWTSTFLSPDEQAAIRKLRVTLADQLTQQQARQAMVEADKLIARRDFAGAISHLKAAAATCTSGKLDDKLAQIEQQQQIVQLRAAATRAEADGNLAKAVDLYRQARAIQDSPALRQSMRKIQSVQEVHRGEQFAASGQLDRAREAFTRALGFADSFRARQWLGRLSDTERRKSLIKAGDEASAKGQFADALRQYELAEKIRGDDSLAKKLLRARHAMYLAQGRRELAAGQFDDALASFNQARKLDANDKQAIAGIAAVDKRRTYQTHLDAGDALRGKSDFAGAMREYRRARQAIDTKQVDARMNDTEFAHLLAQARSFIAEHQYRRAQAVLETARRLDQSPTLNELLKQVNDALAQENDHAG